MPARASTDLTRPTKPALISGVPSAKQKKAPGDMPGAVLYERAALTGQSSSPVAPRKTSVPLPNWLVFDLLKNM